MRLHAKWFLIISTLITPIIMSCNRKCKVDLIITNAKIYTVDPYFSVHESMAVSNGKVVFVGSTSEVQAKYSADETIDIEGKPVYPGFFDPHCHLLSYGLNLQNAWLSGLNSWEEVVKLLVEHQRENPSQWVLGRGWNQNEWDVKEFPSLGLLDEEFPDKPVLLTRIDGHAAIANSAALKLAKVNPDTIIVGGKLIKEKGELTGVLVDNAIDLVRNIIPPYNQTDKQAALEKGQENCFAVGLTSVSDAGLDLGDVLLIDSLQKAGRIRIKINAMLNPTNENFIHFLNNGVYKTHRLSVRTIKLFADGALGSRGALLLEPYSDAPNTVGLQLETKEKLSEICSQAYKAGYQVATHCIGDAAVRLMLDIYEQFLEPENDLRWRIEHAQTVNPDDSPRFGKSSIIPSIQTTHATSDMIWATDRLGDRIKHAYIYQELLNQNGWLPNGSDFPIEHINPLYGFYAGVARKNLAGFPPDGFQMENALTREQALKAMTIWSAKVAFEENEKGSLEPGKHADFVILDEDIMTIPIDSIPSLRVKMTFVDGKVVYLRQND